MAIFDYDAKAAIEFQEHGRETVEAVTVADVSYASPKGGRVPAYLVTPPGRGPFAAVLFMHWGQGDRTEFLSEAVRYARSGAVSLMIDAPYRRPDAKDFAFVADAAAEREMFIQLVVDLRRAVDVLLAQPGVDAGRIAYVGHSLGATWGGALAGVEKRIGSFVLMGGLPRVSDVLGDGAVAKQLQKSFKREQLQAYAETLAPIDPGRFVGHAARAHPVPVRAARPLHQRPRGRRVRKGGPFVRVEAVLHQPRVQRRGVGAGPPGLAVRAPGPQVTAC